MLKKTVYTFIIATFFTLNIFAKNYITAGFKQNPYRWQIQEKITQLKSDDEKVRSAAVESLGFLRAYNSADQVVELLDDKSIEVRRNAVMMLGWCGVRKHIPYLLKMLKDKDWSVRQSAATSLFNLTGFKIEFSALANIEIQDKQRLAWRKAWQDYQNGKRLLGDMTTTEILFSTKNLAYHCPVIASSTYKTRANPSVLTDGKIGNEFWQTKNVPFPQFVTIDLRTPQIFKNIIIYQKQVNLLLKDYAISISNDGKKFKQIIRKQGITNQTIHITIPQQKSRYLRITSYDSTNKVYPTTLTEIEVYDKAPNMQDIEQKIRASAAMGEKKMVPNICIFLYPFLNRAFTTSQDKKTLVQASLRTLGRLRTPQSYATLVKFLHHEQWGHYAAEALADFGDAKAIPELIKAFRKFSVTVNRHRPELVSKTDRPGLSPIDRMYAAPYAIAFAISRLSLKNQQHLAMLKDIAPLLAANLPGDYDTAMIYEPESYQLIFSYLLEKVGMRQLACDAALHALKQKENLPDSMEATIFKKLVSRNSQFGGYNNEAPFAASWLPALCRKKSDIPLLINLLSHNNGWIKINAAKALCFMEATESIVPMFKILKESKTEAEYGYCGTFSFWNNKPDGQDEYNDPCPRWREAFIYCLAKFNAKQCVPLLCKILNDDRNVLEIQYAAAMALDKLGTTQALTALKVAESAHPFHSIKIVAREALWRRGVEPLKRKPRNIWRTPQNPSPDQLQKPLKELVFIKGTKHSPNHYQMDNWRQLYGTTDSGPTYRLGNNLFKLSLINKDAKATPLTNFKDGFVADCEVSWSGKKIIFSHRGGKKNPWWHIFEIDADGKNLKQLTSGPYHDVQPNYLPDGRIVFSSSRLGVRDEYHGYLGTGLTIMNPDGSDIHCVGFNLGRDSEPVIMNDGRIAFSRLELFYSRMKTEWTPQAINPDGTRNVVLYGPERRQFWYDYSRKEGLPWVISGLRHRTLRISQLQPYALGKMLAITQKGLTIIGPGRFKESFIPHDQELIVTTPFVMPNGKIICSAGDKNQYFSRLRKGKKYTYKTNRKAPDLGIYWIDKKTGKLDLIYNDPKTADFEARPIMPRKAPAMLAESPYSHSSRFTGTILCENALFSQEKLTRNRGKYIRVVEALPSVSRHQTHTAGGKAWKNHTGTRTRVWGTFPLGDDGSFFLEVPADRLFHCQVLDSDRRVVGNQQIWMYVRPGETKSCIGCHERPDSAPLRNSFPKTVRKAPLKCLPFGGEFSYRAKFWNKGSLSDEGEERVRTIRSINLMGRQ